MTRACGQLLNLPYMRVIEWNHTENANVFRADFCRSIVLTASFPTVDVTKRIDRSGRRVLLLPLPVLDTEDQLIQFGFLFRGQHFVFPHEKLNCVLRNAFQPSDLLPLS